MLTIRLSRIGKRKNPMYRIIVSEKGRDPKARVLEILGSYNPFTKEIKAKAERINYWLSKGSGISPTANNLLIDKSIIKGEKVKASKPGKKEEAAKDAKPAASATPIEQKTEPAAKMAPAETKTEEVKK